MKKHHIADQIPCIVCEQPHHDGITVLDEFICSKCEQEIVETDVKDKRYAHFVLQLKHLWQTNLLNEQH